MDLKTAIALNRNAYDATRDTRGRLSIEDGEHVQESTTGDMLSAMAFIVYDSHECDICIHDDINAALSVITATSVQTEISEMTKNHPIP